ncbi:hypothetical protein HYW67_01520 [Candidatus Parcubacteria bacterium]|nr:hypothetical protein [Candidatus Parcubacteria bacterium]
MEQQTSTPAGAPPVCTHCSGPTAGYKCAACGEEAETHSSHCGSEENCQAKCAACNEAESKCTC